MEALDATSPKGELYKFHLLCFQVSVEGLVDAINQFLELENHALDSWLGECVVVLNTVQQLRHAPVRIGFHTVQRGLRHWFQITRSNITYASQVSQ